VQEPSPDDVDRAWDRVTRLWDSSLAAEIKTWSGNTPMTAEQRTRQDGRLAELATLTGHPPDGVRQTVRDAVDRYMQTDAEYPECTLSLAAAVRSAPAAAVARAAFPAAPQPGAPKTAAGPSASAPPPAPPAPRPGPSR
jgi:hypothetical protein